MTAPFIYPFIKDTTGKARPYVPIEIVNPHTSDHIHAMALLDTGADACVFPKGIADVTKHNLKGAGVISNITQGVGSGQVHTWKHTFRIHLLDNKDRKKILWKSKDILIDCLDHDSAPILLGTENFLRHFNISFQYSLNRILIMTP